MEVSVKNLALIESARLSFDAGFTVFTGETGAGKSILLDAIGLLLGNRASADVIRTGASKALVEALFELDTDSAGEQAAKLCESFGMELEAGERTLVINREVHANGRTVCRINGHIATVQMLRQLGAQIVHQHGQHEHQGLLVAEEQLRLLDLFGRHGALLNRTRDRYTQWSEAQAALATAQQNEQERVRRLDMLTFQIDEIESANLQVGEEAELKAVRGRLQYAEKISAAIDKALAALDGASTQPGVAALLTDAMGQVAAASAHDASLQPVCDLVETAQVHADEAVRSLFKYRDSIDTDPNRLEQLEDRLAEIRRLQRKYGATAEDVLSYLQKSVQERDETLDYEAHLTRLQQAASAAKDALFAVSQELHDARQVAARALSGEVEAVLRTLTLPNAQLQIQVSKRTNASGEERYGPHGSDDVVFLFSANRGEPLRPLSRIASGGELSRVLLAFKSVLAQVDDIDTLIFDEIDVGVSGAAAQRIAERLQEIGRTRQILCVTHSPQVAAAAAAHYYIEKSEADQSTTTAIERLDDMGRVHEIARLVGGSVAGETARVHATALLEGFHHTQ